MTSPMSLIDRFCHAPTRDCFIKWGLSLATAAILAGLMVCLYWVIFDRKRPIENLRGDVVLYQKQPDYSWVFIVRWTATLKRRCPGISKRWIFGDFRLPLSDIPYPEEPTNHAIGDEVSWQVPVHVPSYFVSTGHTGGQYRVRLLYSCNPMQERIFPVIEEAPVVYFDLPIDNPPLAPVPSDNPAPPPFPDP